MSTTTTEFRLSHLFMLANEQKKKDSLTLTLGGNNDTMRSMGENDTFFQQLNERCAVVHHASRSMKLKFSPAENHVCKVL